MIIEDLLWRDDVSPCGLPRGFQGLLDGVDCLLESEPCEIRFLGVLDTVGVIFDLRTALGGEKDWGAPADVAVLVVREVSLCQSPRIRDPMVLWDVTRGVAKWACRMGQVHTPGQIEIVGTRASVYGGKIVGLPEGQPFLGESDLGTIRAGWPTWHSIFELTIEPEHSDPEFLGGK